jgi:hypothetical protein
MLRLEVLAFCCVFVIACNDSQIVNVGGNTVSVTFDLQEGFQGHSVTIMVDTVLCFRAVLSSAVPLAGPIATFNTVLTRDRHYLKVSWMGLANKTDTANFTLGQSSRYFIGLRIESDTLALEIRDEPFLYL